MSRPPGGLLQQTLQPVARLVQRGGHGARTDLQGLGYVLVREVVKVTQTKHRRFPVRQLGDGLPQTACEFASQDLVLWSLRGGGDADAVQRYGMPTLPQPV